MVRRWCCSLLIFGMIGPSFAAYFTQQQTVAPAPQTESPTVGKAPDSNDHLGLASHHLENGDRLRACDHFRRYLVQYPTQWDIRAFYAELLLKDARYTEAAVELRRCIADAQSDRLATPNHFIKGHHRLLEIAVRNTDSYQIHLQRGLALYWLAQARRELGDINGKFSMEGVLTKAAHEMSQAHRRDPNQARPCWYASQVWRRLGRRQLAQSWLIKAEQLSAISHLTPSEQMQMSLAGRDMRFVGGR